MTDTPTVPTQEQTDKIVIGKILEIAPHPAADKLRLCSVLIKPATPETIRTPDGTGAGGAWAGQRIDAEPADIRQIICGASNVEVGAYVPVATHGARLPDNTKIRKGKIRGVQSLGMICSLKELGFEDESEGIFKFPEYMHCLFEADTPITVGGAIEVGAPALPVIRQVMDETPPGILGSVT